MSKERVYFLPNKSTKNLLQRATTTIWIKEVHFNNKNVRAQILLDRTSYYFSVELQCSLNLFTHRLFFFSGVSHPNLYIILFFPINQLCPFLPKMQHFLLFFFFFLSLSQKEQEKIKTSDLFLKPAESIEAQWCFSPGYFQHLVWRLPPADVQGVDQ